MLPAIPLALVRERAKEAVERSSERSVAREVGVVARSLHLFIIGEGTPRTSTVRMLRDWYVRRAARLGSAEPETYGAALALLTPGIPPNRREHARRRVLECVRDVYRDQEVPVPAALAVLLHAHGVEGL